MDEAVPAIRCSWRHCQKGKGKNIESVERGVLLADEVSLLQLYGEHSLQFSTKSVQCRYLIVAATMLTFQQKQKKFIKKQIFTKEP